jgi:Leucine-rich repeat (LRR) protein
MGSTMRFAFAVLIPLCVAFATLAQPGPTAEEKAAMAAVMKLGGKTAIDPELPAGSRVTAKFDTATDATLKSLSKHPEIGSIQALEGRGCTEKGFKALHDLPNLRRLTLNVSGISDKELEVIVECKNLRELIIPASGVTDAGTAVLAKLPRLEALDLSENPRITDKAMTAIAGLERLERLFLGKTGLTDKGLMELKPLEGLRDLHVAGTKVTANAAEKFADEMPNLRVVRR